MNIYLYSQQKLYSMISFHTLLLLFSFYLHRTYAQIVCQGNFELYQLQCSTKNDYCYFPSNLTCWYSKDLVSGLQIKPYSSQIADLSTNHPIKLCQAITLDIGVIYHIEYDLYTHLNTDVNLSVTLNGQNISELNVTSAGNFHGGNYFSSVSSNNQLCFSQAILQTRQFMLGYSIGGCIDNVTIYPIAIPSPNNTFENITSSNATGNSSSSNISTEKSVNATSNSSYSIDTSTNSTNNSSSSNISTNNSSEYNISGKNLSMITNIINSSNLKQEQLTANITNESVKKENETIQIQFVCLSHENEGFITLNSKQIFNQSMNRELFRQYRLIIKKEEAQFVVEKDSQGYLAIKIFPLMSFSLKYLRFESRIKAKEYPQQSKIQFSLRLVYVDTYFKYFSPPILDFANFVSDTTSIAGNITKNTIVLARNVFCSYFVLNLLAFWNISLMYIFLLQPAVPQFTQDLYYQLFSTLNRQDSFFSWLSNYVEVPQYLIEPPISLNFLQQRLEKHKQQFKWFGYFNMSSKVLENNYDHLVNILVLIFKVIIVKVILIAISKYVSNFSKCKPFVFELLVVELMTITPEIMISCLSCVGYGVSNYMGKMHKVVQLLLGFICITCLAIFPIITYKNRVKKVKVKKLRAPIKTQRAQIFSSKLREQNNQKIQYKIKVFYMLQQKKYINIVDNMLLFTTPIMVMIGNQIGFFVVNSAVIGLKTYFLINNFTKLDMKQKVIYTSMNCVWIVHHVVFMCFYFVTDEDGDPFSDDIEFISILGMIACITVILGAVLDIAEIIIDLIKWIWKVVSKICSTIFDQNKQNGDCEQEKDRENTEEEMNKNLNIQPIYIPVDLNKPKSFQKNSHYETKSIQVLKETPISKDNEILSKYF